MNALSEHAKAEIDRWIKIYPEGQKQSAVLAAMREVQHENVKLIQASSRDP